MLSYLVFVKYMVQLSYNLSLDLALFRPVFSRSQECKVLESTNLAKYVASDSVT